MKQIISFLMGFMLLFACVNNNHNKSTIEVPTMNTSTDSTRIILADEFIVFWNKFSEALLQNDTLTLSDLINDEIINGGGLCFTNVSNITTMDFKCEPDTINDMYARMPLSTISKSKFLKEFKQSLNPVYLRLLKKYNIREDLESKNYRCSESIKNYDFIVKTLYRGNSQIVLLSYNIKNNSTNPDAHHIILLFAKTDGKIKLRMISYDFDDMIEVYPLNTNDELIIIDQ